MLKDKTSTGTYVLRKSPLLVQFQLHSADFIIVRFWKSSNWFKRLFLWQFSPNILGFSTKHDGCGFQSCMWCDISIPQTTALIGDSLYLPAYFKVWKNRAPWNFPPGTFDKNDKRTLRKWGFMIKKHQFWCFFNQTLRCFKSL